MCTAPVFHSSNTIDFELLQNFASSLGIPHVAEEIHHTGVNNKQDTAAGSQPENLGDEPLVESREPFLLGDRRQGGPGPVVLRNLAGNLDAILDTALHDVHG